MFIAILKTKFIMGRRGMGGSPKAFIQELPLTIFLQIYGNSIKSFSNSSKYKWQPRLYLLKLLTCGGRDWAIWLTPLFGICIICWQFIWYINILSSYIAVNVLANDYKKRNINTQIYVCISVVGVGRGDLYSENHWR